MSMDRVPWRALLPARRTPPKTPAQPPRVCMLTVEQSDRTRLHVEALLLAGYDVEVLSIGDPDWMPKLCALRPFAVHGAGADLASRALSAAQVCGAYGVCDVDLALPQSLAARLALSNANVLIAAADSVAGAIQRGALWRRRRAHIIVDAQPPVDICTNIRAALGLGPAPFLLYWEASRYTEADTRLVIEALRRAPDAVVAIATPDAATLDLIAAAGMAQRMISTPGTPTALGGVDVALCLTGAEPRVAWRMFAAGVPLLGGDNRMLRDELGDLVVGAYDVATLAASIAALQRSPKHVHALRERMRNAYRTIRRDFGPPRLAAIYDELRSTGRSAAPLSVPPLAPPALPLPGLAEAPLVCDPLVGFPAAVVRPNLRFARPYRADRANMTLKIRDGEYLREQPVSLWSDNDAVHPDGPSLLRRREDLPDGEELVVLDDRLFDLSVGSPMVAVQRRRDRRCGYITIDTLLAKSTACDGVWVAQDESRLRSVVEFPSRWGMLYSTNRVGEEELRATRAYLDRYADDVDRAAIDKTHPLEFGAMAHRIGVWALADRRAEADRADIAERIDRAMRRYAVPAMMESGGAAAWPYRFDFAMPWATKLIPPWHSGYANAAMVGAAACAYALTGAQDYAEVSRKAFRFLQRPMAEGGAHYRVDGFDYIAEYIYRSPPTPNARVLDGEMCAIPYIVNAGLLLDEPEMLRFAFALAAGQKPLLEMLTTADGAPYFCMDGQAMQPNYMWQLWMCMQLLAAIFKDRDFAEIARRWRAHIPQKFETDENYPF